MVKPWYYQNVICGSKKSRFKNQEAKGLLSNLGLATLLSKVPFLGDILFWVQLRWEYKMNKIAHKFLVAGDKFMPEMHLKQPRCTCSACRLFTENKENWKI